jgi:lipopolysaccharide export system permease protein
VVWLFRNGMFIRIIDRYIVMETGKACLACFLVFLVTGMIAGFLPLLQKGMESGLDLTVILFQALINALPGTLVTTAPLSITIGILLALGGLAADNEIVALKASGVSIARLLPPTMVGAVVGFLVSLLCTMVLIPKGVAQGRKLVREALTTRADAGIEQRSFFDGLKGLTLYVETLDRATGTIKNVFLRETSDPQEPKTILAKRGRVLPDPEGKALIIQLMDGVVIAENAQGDAMGTLEFESQVFRRPIGEGDPEAASRSLEEMTIREILEKTAEAEALETTTTGASKEFYRRSGRLGRMLVTQRFTHPAACLALALVAFPLGMFSLGRSRLNNTALGMVVIFFYYAASLAAERAARSGTPPEMILPAVPVAFGCLGLYLTHRANLERPPRIVKLLMKATKALKLPRPPTRKGRNP